MIYRTAACIRIRKPPHLEPRAAEKVSRNYLNLLPMGEEMVRCIFKLMNRGQAWQLRSYFLKVRVVPTGQPEQSSGKLAHSLEVAENPVQ